jgi:cytochrome c peroxidase
MRRILRLLVLTGLAGIALHSLATAQGGVPAVVPGFPNVPQTPGAILSGLNAPQQGRTAILAYHNGQLFTVPEVPSSQPGSDFQVRTWSLANPSAPAELATWGTTPMPINAHGYFHSGEYLILGANWPPEAPWSFRVNGSQGVTRTTFPNLLCAGVRGCLFGPWFVGETWWSYGAIEGNATISRNWTELAEWDHLGLTGVVGHPFLLGDLLIFASDQSRTGVATYDVSDPTNPVLLDVLTQGGPGGYWPELWSGDGKLYVVFPYQTEGNGFRVVDATDPSDLRFVTDRPLPGDEAMYAQFQDEYAFIGSHKIDMRTFESVLDLDGANTVRPNDGGVGINTSQFALPLGNLLVTGGIGPNQGMAVWAHQAAPDTRGPAVTYHVPQAGRTNYPVGAPITLLIHETLETKTIVPGVSLIVRPLGGNAIAGTAYFSFDDVLTFVPTQPLATNTTYEVVLPAGGIKDAAGNGMVGSSFTFSTGSTVGGNQPPQVTSLTASAYPVAPGASVTLSATASDANGDALQYRFDFGDGTPRTDWSSTPSASHSYASPGHYRASVQVRDPAGAVGSSASTVTVLLAPAGPRPTHSSPILLDAVGERIWSVNADADTLTAVDRDSLGVLVEVATCDGPKSVARAGNGELWVACGGGDRLRIHHGTTGAALADLPTGYGSAPAGLAFNPAGTTAFVALGGAGRLLRFDAATRQQTASLALGRSPHAVAVAADGARVLVTRFLSGPNQGEVWDVAANAMTLTRTLRLPKIGGEQNRDGTAAGRGAPNQLAAIAIAPDGGSAWVAGTKPNLDRGLLIGPDLDPDNTVRTALVELDLTTNAVTRTIDLDNSDSPSALAFSPLGDYLFITLQGNNEVTVLDALVLDEASGLGAFFTRLGTGAAPQGVVADGVTGRTFVHDFLGRSTTVLETDALFRRGSKTVPASAVATVANEPLAPAVAHGKRLFYHASDTRMSAEGYLSCATCHLDGGHDGQVWDFTGRGEGLRNTTELRGRGGVAHGNVHWSANFDEIQDFENDMRLAFGGSGFLSDSDFAQTQAPLGPAKAGLSADLDALAAYVTSLGASAIPKSPFRNADGSMTAEAVAGRQVFRNLGCNSCHGGATFTDSQGGAGRLHDVGTLRTTSGGRLGEALLGIDTPTLLGAWDSAPYFHDGSAPSLESVFSVAGGRVLAAESGTRTGGAQLVANFVDLNNDDTVRGRAYVELGDTGARVSFGGLEGGAGGVGAVELRYSASSAQAVVVTVNGQSFNVNLANPGNNPSWRHTNWLVARLEGVSFNAGTVNTVEVSSNAAFPNVSLDEIVVSSPNDLGRTQPHRQVLALPTSERNALLAYLRQLDGTPEDNPIPELFSDGFESGNTSAWSSTVDP